MKSLFTVWSASRLKKAFILLDDEQDGDKLYDELILKASSKLDVNGVSLVLESNGTPVDEDILPFIKSEILILLERDEQWNHPGAKDTSKASIITSVSTSSTITNISEAEEHNENKNIEILFTVDCNTEYAWSSFEIPWNKLFRTQIETLDSGKKPDRPVLINLIHITVDEMRSIKDVIPSKAFKIIAKKMIDRYPTIFRDVDDDGVVLGDGTHSLVCKLQDRNNYLNRPHKRKNPSTPDPVSNKKKFVSARAGCSNWSPKVHVQEENEQNILERARTVRDNDQDFFELLEASYAEHRRFLNESEPPTILKIKEEWPIIFSTKAIFWHFTKLTNSDIHLLNNITDKAEKILKVTSSLQKKSAPEVHDKENEIDVIGLEEKTFRNIVEYFKEDYSSFHLKYQNISDINLEGMPLTPTIIEVGIKPMVNYYVYFEKESINNVGQETFLEALKVAYALYFILNIKYPKDLSTTMEFLQRMFLKIHPDSGSKSKKVSSVRRRVFNFINKLVSM